MMELFNYFPPHMRDQKLKAVKGQRAVKFPASYFRKAPQAMHVQWENVCTMDDEGNVIKTAPDFLVDKLIKYLKKMGQPFEVFSL